MLPDYSPLEVSRETLESITGEKDMTTNNQWSESASQYVEAYDTWKDAENTKQQKRDAVIESFPANHKKAYGHGIEVTRTKKGHTIRIAKDK